MSQLDPTEVEAQAARALAEDWRGTDLTGAAVVDPGQRCLAQVVAREDGVLCGVALATEVFRQVDSAISCSQLLQDGDHLSDGSVAMRVEGPAQGVLVGERTALNFMQHLSGIASLTARFVAVASEYGVEILDTRKTIPGLRALEKYATRTGGARNHRMGLYDAILIKDNHCDLAGGLAAALERARARHPARELEVEVRSTEELEVALRFGIGRVLLDNFTPEAAVEAVKLVEGRSEIEISGGVDLDNLGRYAAARSQYISVGRLTQSAPALDLAMKVVPSARPGFPPRR
ncbi:MAG: carboxylating nicotinate-nucleotide diphosphorylase [Candidatus Dormibacteria bacterium]